MQLELVRLLDANNSQVQPYVVPYFKVWSIGEEVGYLNAPSRLAQPPPAHTIKRPGGPNFGSHRNPTANL